VLTHIHGASSLPLNGTEASSMNSILEFLARRSSFDIICCDVKGSVWSK